jgi:Amt family ammonium transporter
LTIFAVVSLVWAIWGYSLAFAGSFILMKIIDRITPLRVSPEEEEKGLDQTQFGEDAYSEE